MKLDQLRKLLKAAEAKKQVERTELANLRTARRALEREAESLQERATHSALPMANDLTGGDLKTYNRHCGHLQERAQQKRESAADYNAPIAAQEEALRGALRQEIAWENLFHRARTENRIENEKRDEQTREEATLRK